MNYVLNSTHKDGAGKAKKFEGLGLKTKAGGYERPYTREAFDLGASLQKQVTEGLHGARVEMTMKPAEILRGKGIYYTSHQVVQGVNEKKGKQMEFAVGWVDKRNQDGTTTGRPDDLRQLLLFLKGEKMIKRPELESWRAKVFAGEPEKQSPKFNLNDRVRLTRDFQEDVFYGPVIPKGKVGIVSDVSESAVDGSISYVVTFPKIEEWVVANPSDIKLHPPGTRDLPKNPPKVPKDLK